MVLSWVPQGSVLGRVLFLLFINDMPAITTNVTSLFADDSKLIGRARSITCNHSVGLTLLIPMGWPVANEINESKCSVLHIGKDSRRTRLKNNYRMDHTPLQMVEKERDLGVVVSAGDILFWAEQVRAIIEKQNKWRHGSLRMLCLGNQKC